MRASVHINTYTQMFVTGLFITAKKWKQFRCPSYEWINVIYSYKGLFGNYTEMKD